jgi:hypothetical protein
MKIQIKEKLMKRINTEFVSIKCEFKFSVNHKNYETWLKEIVAFVESVKLIDE